jgi:energy-coupling factor transporter ATP-binding protein EcfA2
LELVYLWVEKYKNIKKQGFNFLPRFECKYEDGKLTICDKKKKKCKDNDYIENFFDKEGKINVTAIVGENGSGKSSILEILTNSLSESSKYNEIFATDESKFFLIYKYKNDDEIDFFSLKVGLPLSLKITNEKYKIEDIGIQRLFLQHENLIAILLNNESATRRFYHEQFQLFIGNTQQHITHIQKIIFSNFINKRNDFFQKDTNKFFIPTKIKIISKHNYNVKLTDEIILCIKEFKMNKAMKKIRLLEKDFESTSYRGLLNTAQSGTRDLYTFEINEIDEKKLKKIFLLKSDLIDIEICDETRSFKDLSYGERQLLTNLNFILFYSKQKKYIERKQYYDEDTMKKPKYDKERIKFNKVLVLLDEFELGLHPNWQKKSIKYITDFLQHITDKEFHLIITSHSPFILSDIPKQNIIFLDTYNKKKSEKKYPNLTFDDLKDGNCINVTNEIDIKPFGANIHNLLADGFFMDDGLMGEFAKNKIKKIVKQLNAHKEGKIELKIPEQQNIKKVIQAIGEPFLNQKLWNMYQSLFNDTEAEKRRLKEEMDRIKKKLEGLN